jgi:hypothetical protein
MYGEKQNAYWVLVGHPEGKNIRKARTVILR